MSETMQRADTGARWEIYAEDDFYPVVEQSAFLSERTSDPDPSVAEAWKAFLDEYDTNERGYLDTWQTTVHAFFDHLRSLGWQLAGFYNEGEPFGFCTYNEENILSEDFSADVFTPTSPDGECYGFHGFIWTTGPDVGSRPDLYSIGHDDDTDIFDYNRAYAHCDTCGCTWSIGDYSATEWHHEGYYCTHRYPAQDVASALFDSSELIDKNYTPPGWGELHVPMDEDGFVDEYVIRCHCGGTVEVAPY